MTVIKFMQLIIGLGNPGKEYEKTRHNAGFIMLDKIRENYKFPDFEFNKKFNAETSISTFPPLLSGESASQQGRDVPRSGTGEGNFVGNAQVRSNEKIILAKPQTMMNNSGQSVKALLDFYKLAPKNLIVIHDDIDIELGNYKTATDSGSAGHRGIEDIISKIGTQKFSRVRVGVGNAYLRSKIDPTDFVLGKFTDEELKTLIDEVGGNIFFEIEKLI
jgi:peptidyl-tRNA hydrolase, PTH1 family